MSVNVFVLSFLGALSSASAPASATTVPSFGHVFVIVGENKSLSQLNSLNAPYTMNTLKPESAWFTDYHATATNPTGTGASLAEYISLTSGQFASCEVSGPCGQQNVPSIFSQLGSGAWQDWNESMVSNCNAHYTGADSTLNAYKPGHNPALFFTGLPCSTQDVPAGTTGPDDMSAFNAALAEGAVPEYNFVSPNLCEDGHNSCNGADRVTEFDNFLQREIPLIEASPAFGSNGVILVTYDEPGGGQTDTHVPMLVLGPQVHAGTYSGYYDHYSTLATIEQGLGLNCLANACAASALAISGNPPQSPSVSISQPTNGSTVSGTLTVAGTAAAQGDASISHVQVRIDNGTPETATGTTNWSASIDTKSLVNGRHTIIATVTDSNDLIAATSIDVTVSNSRPSASTPCHTGITPVPIEHVIVIMEENESESSVIGSSSAPYLNSLANTCALATNYHNTDHPSTPNYLELTSGTAQGKATYKDCAYSGCPQSQENIFDELTAAGESWKGYAESMPSNCDTASTTLYAARHNPPQFYSDLHNSTASSCSALDVPLGSGSDTTGGPVVTAGNFSTDLTNNTLPNLAWIAPNLCDDGHSVSLGPSYCTGNRIKNLDTWLAAWVPSMLNSPEYVSGNTELMIVFDEGTGGDKTTPEACWDQTHADTSLYPSCWTTAVFVGPNTPQLTSSIWFNHYDTLNVIASILGVPTFSGNATTGYPTSDDLRTTFGL